MMEREKRMEMEKLITKIMEMIERCKKSFTWRNDDWGNTTSFARVTFSDGMLEEVRRLCNKPDDGMFQLIETLLSDRLFLVRMAHHLWYGVCDTASFKMKSYTYTIKNVRMAEAGKIYFRVYIDKNDGVTGKK